MCCWFCVAERLRQVWAKCCGLVGSGLAPAPGPVVAELAHPKNQTGNYGVELDVKMEVKMEVEMEVKMEVQMKFKIEVKMEVEMEVNVEVKTEVKT